MARRVLAALALVVLAAGAVTSCGGDDGAEVRQLDDGGPPESSQSASQSASAPSEGCATAGEVAASGTGASEVEVELGEWVVRVDPAEVPPGEIEFVATNIGAVPHELVLVAAASPDELTVVDGKVDEDALPEGSFVGEIEAFAPGLTCDGYAQLSAGSYVAFCNIVNDDGTSHFEQGMVTTFTVG